MVLNVQSDIPYNFLSIFNYIGNYLGFLNLIVWILYVLPWGQMSFWAATVITSLVTAVPYIGTDIVYVLWGGFSVDNATLNRFFSLHFFLPFLIFALSIIHILLLHEHGSTNPLGILSKVDSIPFTPYYTIKDSYTVFILLIGFCCLIFYYPNLLGHSDNYILGNPMVTPPHIVPEWYFLPFYAILRSVPDKLIGFLLLLLSIIILLLLPFISNLNMLIKSGYFKPGYKIFIILFFFNWIILGWIGGQPIASPFYEIGQFATIFYFLFFTIIIIILNLFEFVQFYNYSYSNHYLNSNIFNFLENKFFLKFLKKDDPKFLKNFKLFFIFLWKLTIWDWLHIGIWVLILRLFF